MFYISGLQPPSLEKFQALDSNNDGKIQESEVTTSDKDYAGAAKGIPSEFS